MNLFAAHVNGRLRSQFGAPRFYNRGYRGRVHAKARENSASSTTTSTKLTNTKR
jgi:hypothetical protein